MGPTNLTLDFEIILELLGLFWTLMGYFWVAVIFKNVFGSHHKAEISFSLLPSIKTFVFDLILGFLEQKWAILGAIPTVALDLILGPFFFFFYFLGS